MPTVYLYSLLATRIAQRGNLRARPNQDAATVAILDRCEDEIERLVKEFMPSGAGFDSGTTLDLDKTTTARLVFNTSFHHMNDSGMYDGWTDHTVTMSATFAGPSIKISGRNRNDIKDYIAETFLLTIARQIDCQWDAERSWMHFYLKLEA